MEIRIVRKSWRSWGAAVCIALVAGCASNGSSTSNNGLGGLSDPLEPTNRAVFKFNLAVDDAIGRPITRVYRVIPKYGRDRIRDFINHYKSPVTFFNDLLQGEVRRAQETFVRFWVNMFLGVGGLYDYAGKTGLPGHTEDFGQTLAVWGLKPGPYLMLPLLGPHTTRHAVGRVADNYTNPFGYLLSDAGVGWVSIIGAAVDAIDTRERTEKALDDLRRTSLDFYAAIRSLYWQNRRSEIKNGKVGKIPLPGEDE